MLLGYIGLSIIITILVIGIIIYMKNENLNENLNKNLNKKTNTTENFLSIDDSSLYINNESSTNTNDNKPIDIKYQIPVSANQLSDNELQSIDSDILRNVRVLANFSMTDEFDYYQMYSLLKKLKNTKYNFNYEPVSDDKKSKILSSEKLIKNNSGAINDTDLELFSRLKLELISAFNSLIIKNNLFVPYHPYQFFKIINSNMISNTMTDKNKLNNKLNNNLNNNKFNFVFTLTLAREYKFQQFIIYYDLDLTINGKEYIITLNKVELLGIPIPNTIEFHPNQKTEFKIDNTNINQTDNNQSDNNQTDNNSKDNNIDFYYEDQVSDSLKFDVMPSGDPSIRNYSPNVKYIDITETSDMDSTFFNESSQSYKVEDRIMNVARDQQFTNHRCYGLVNGISKELPQYKNPIFCKSFHPEINQNGIWDAPCQVNSDCPFYKANKNYPNEFGKCDKVSGQCEMPMGIIPIGFTKYGKTEPNCYNCGSNSVDSKCCGKQEELVKSRLVNYRSADYVFSGDEASRKQFENEIKKNGLLVNPSI